MRHALERLAGLVLAGLLVVVPALPAAALDADALHDVERHIARGLEENNVPGAALAVVGADGTVHLRGFGTAARTGAPVTPDTPFVIGSVTKSFTALVVMQLVEDGAIDLDAPVSRYLPWFAVEPAAWSARVTVRMLIDHTSGLAADAGGPALQWFQDLPISEAARQVVGTQLRSEPGTAWAYATANYVLLGALVESVADQPFGEVLRLRVLEPLGMRRTFTDLEPARAAGMTDGHRYWFGVPLAHLSYRQGMVPAGLLISTAADMSRYLRMVLGHGELDGRRVLSAEGMRQLVEPTVPAVLGPWAKDPAAGYAMGWFVGAGPFGPERAIFHPGATPDSGALAAVLPDREQAVMVMVNAAPRVNMPGAAGAVDRIAAGAVSILMEAEPASGSSMRSYYVVFDVLIGLALVASVAAVARARRRRPVRRRGLQVAGALAPAGAAVLLLGVPDLTGAGWAQSWLWAPDHVVAVLAISAALLVLTVVRLRVVLRPPAGPDAGAAREHDLDGRVPRSPGRQRSVMTAVYSSPSSRRMKSW